MALALLPAGFVLAYSFWAGGYFPGATAWGIVVLSVVLLVRVVVGRARPQAFGRPARLVVVALALLAGLTILSALWSRSPWRALVEFDRVVLYLTAFALFASAALTPNRARIMVRGLAGAFVLVCAAALIARLLPGLYPLAVTFDGYGLDHPVTYANTLGLMAVLGIVLCVHVSAADGEPPRARVLAAAAVPALVTTLILTGSHGAALAGVAGLVVLAVVARPPQLAWTLAAVLPTTALAAASASGAGVLASADSTSAAALGAGALVAGVVALSVANAALLRWLALRFGDRLAARMNVVAVRRGVVVVVAVAVVAVAALLTSGGTPLGGGPAAGPSGARVDHWEVALTGFAGSPLLGGGAGTYELLSQRERGLEATIRDAHSLPLETLGELGVAGLALLALALGGLLLGLARGRGGRDHALYAIAFTFTLTWLIHAAIDWDWEMPVVTLPVFALGGAALGLRRAGPPESAATGAPSAARATAAALLTAVVIIAALVAVSDIQLRAARTAARAGGCDGIARQVSAFPLSVRPDGREQLGRCELARAKTSAAERARHAERAALAFAAAARLDPGDRSLRAQLTRARRLARAGGT